MRLAAAAAPLLPPAKRRLEPPASSPPLRARIGAQRAAEELESVRLLAERALVVDASSRAAAPPLGRAAPGSSSLLQLSGGSSLTRLVGGASQVRAHAPPLHPARALTALHGGAAPRPPVAAPGAAATSRWPTLAQRQVPAAAAETAAAASILQALTTAEHARKQTYAAARLHRDGLADDTVAALTMNMSSIAYGKASKAGASSSPTTSVARRITGRRDSKGEHGKNRMVPLGGNRW